MNLGKWVWLCATAVSTFAISGPSVSKTVWVDTVSRAPEVGKATPTPMPVGTRLNIVVALKLRNKVALDHEVARSSGSIKTAAEFMAAYSPTTQQVDAVKNYLTTNGFSEIHESGNRLLVTATGSVAQAQAAFGTKINQYFIDGRTVYANATPAKVPDAYRDIVLGVQGLQNVTQYHTTYVKSDAVPKRPFGLRALSAFYGPIPGPDGSSTGEADTHNAMIGVVTQGDVTQVVSDLYSFAAAEFPTSALSVTPVSVSAQTGDTSNAPQWNIDTQASFAAAGGQIHQMRLYNMGALTAGDLTQALNQAVVDNAARVINVSLAQCEFDAARTGDEAIDDQIFEQAVAQGQTFSVASGNSGAYNCGSEIWWRTYQNYPAVSPYVVAVGGTSLADAPTKEFVWSCKDQGICALGGGSGGPSRTEPAANWQLRSGVLGTATSRGVPDISFDADPNSGALIRFGSVQQPYGGTGLSAALFTGFYARVQASHSRLGFAGIPIYRVGAKSFNDVTFGIHDYPAREGWDYATGYGSLILPWFAKAAVLPIQPVMTLESASAAQAFPDVRVVGPVTSPATTQLLKNPGFEIAGQNAKFPSGFDAWYGGGDITADPGRITHAGNIAAIFGQGGAVLAQMAIIPDSAKSATLSFYLDTYPDAPKHEIVVRVEELSYTASPVVKIQRHYSSLTEQGGFQRKTLDLTALKGKMVFIEFETDAPPMAYAGFALDDVTLEVTQ